MTTVTLTIKRDFSNWTVDQFARHYAETLHRPANGLGQHLSPLFGQSHHIMTAARKCYDAESVEHAFAKAVRETEAY